MPVIVAVLLFGMLLAMLFIGAWGMSDQSMRRLMLRVILFSVVVAALLVAWLFSSPTEPPITNGPTTVAP